MCTVAGQKVAHFALSLGALVFLPHKLIVRPGTLRGAL